MIRTDSLVESKPTLFKIPPRKKKSTAAISEKGSNASNVNLVPFNSKPINKIENIHEKENIEIAEDIDEVYTVVEQQPEFSGGMAALGQFLSRNLRYPPEAQKTNTSGRVFISFVVNTDGTIQDVQILKGLGFGTDEEAARVVKAMPKWRPGKQSGRPVRVKYNLPINFTLE